MPAPTSNTDELDDGAKQTARKSRLALAHQMTVDRHGDDVLGHVRPTIAASESKRQDAARADLGSPRSPWPRRHLPGLACRLGCRVTAMLDSIAAMGYGARDDDRQSARHPTSRRGPGECS